MALKGFSFCGQRCFLFIPTGFGKTLNTVGRLLAANVATRGAIINLIGPHECDFAQSLPKFSQFLGVFRGCCFSFCPLLRFIKDSARNTVHGRYLLRQKRLATGGINCGPLTINTQ